MGVSFHARRLFGLHISHGNGVAQYYFTNMIVAKRVVESRAAAAALLDLAPHGSDMSAGLQKAQSQP
jgi:hypothetical protein